MVGDSGGAMAAPQQPARFFKRGSGLIKIRSTKNNHRFVGRYRARGGKYLPRALQRINRVFDGDHRKPQTRISLRLIELLAHLRDHHRGGWITLNSGYRSPRYNKNLRKRGKTVAKASLHLFGMAADLRITGVDSKKVWQYIRDKKIAGAGYYGNPRIHVDVGPARSWTQGTANVRSGKSDHNKRVILVPEYDIYASAETLRLDFARMTAYPISLKARALVLERREGKKWRRVQTFTPRLRGGARPGACKRFDDRLEMLGLRWRLPAELPSGRYRVRVTFCNKKQPAMPAEITSYEFQVRPASQ